MQDCFAVKTFRVPCLTFNVSGLKGFGSWKSPSHLVLIAENVYLRCGSATKGLSVSCSAFRGWEVSGLEKSPSQLVLIAENVNLRCGSATKGWRYAFNVQYFVFRVSRLWSLKLLVLASKLHSQNDFKSFTGWSTRGGGHLLLKVLLLLLTTYFLPLTSF